MIVVTVRCRFSNGGKGRDWRRRGEEKGGSLNLSLDGAWRDGVRVRVGSVWRRRGGAAEAMVLGDVRASKNVQGRRRNERRIK